MSVPITNPCKRCRIGGACAGEYCWPVMPPCAMLVEAHSTAPNSASDAIPLPIIRKVFDEIVDCRQDVIDNFIDALVRAAKQHTLP